MPSYFVLFQAGVNVLHVHDLLGLFFFLFSVFSLFSLWLSRRQGFHLLHLFTHTMRIPDLTE